MVGEHEDPCDKRLVDSLCCTSSNDISYLKGLGIVKDLPEGGSIIESNRRLRFRLPEIQNGTALRTEEGQIWLNM